MTKTILIRCAEKLHCYAGDARGSVAIMAGLFVPALLAIAGLAIDYTNLTYQRQNLQTIADGAALAGAAELRLGNANSTTILQVAQNYVKSSGGGLPIIFSGTVSSDKTTVQVSLRETVQTLFMQNVNANLVNLNVSATAKVVGGAPVCVVGLDASALFTVGLKKQAHLFAPNCAVYSNSKDPSGLYALNNAVLTAAFICSGGGISGAGSGSFTPTPQTDCPTLPDPLINRPAPPAGSCTYTNYVVSGGTPTLFPGTYCGGLTINNSANVILSSGVYVMQNGPFYVTGGASVQGTNVGFFLTGKGAVLDFDSASTISLTAPITGTMAGLLFFEDRASPQAQTHKILSNNARMLLGTIYLPQGILYIGANSPVADQSAYTIVVVRQFYLTAGPTMVLNTNYSATTIPVPNGLGPLSGHSVLTQ
jgi:Flp pilus assembly protein TadG